ncbi:MAG: hypothetical protein IJV22_01290 [Bacteroidales bacterium]|nr:hypothetical protein [Bacteroidales bacterium]
MPRRTARGWCAVRLEHPRRTAQWAQSVRHVQLITLVCPNAIRASLPICRTAEQPMPYGTEPYAPLATGAHLHLSIIKDEELHGAGRTMAAATHMQWGNGNGLKIV